MTTPNERQPIYDICEQNGIGVMTGVFDVILDRGNVDVERVLAYLRSNDSDAFHIYEGWIARAIDALSDEIESFNPPPE